MSGINGKVKGKPAPATTGRPSHDALGRSIFALHVEVALGLHFAGLNESDSRRLEFALVLAFGGNFGGARFPGCGRVEVPIDSIGAPMQAIEGDEVHIVFAADTVRAKISRFISDRLYPISHRLSGGNENRHWFGSGSVAATATCVFFRAKITRENERSPKNGDAI